VHFIFTPFLFLGSISCICCTQSLRVQSCVCRTSQSTEDSLERCRCTRPRGNDMLHSKSLSCGCFKGQQIPPLTMCKQSPRARYVGNVGMPATPRQAVLHFCLVWAQASFVSPPTTFPFPVVLSQDRGLPDVASMPPSLTYRTTRFERELRVFRESVLPQPGILSDCVLDVQVSLACCLPKITHISLGS
jgi:hypothetical protein